MDITDMESEIWTLLIWSAESTFINCLLEQLFLRSEINTRNTKLLISTGQRSYSALLYFGLHQLMQPFFHTRAHQ